MRVFFLLVLVLCTCSLAQPEPEQQDLLLDRRKLAERRMKANEAAYNFPDASDDFKRYHSATFDPALVSELRLLEKTVVPLGTSPRRRMRTTHYLPTEIADTVRSMALWSHICAAVGMAESTDVNTVAFEMIKRGDVKWIDPLMWFGADPNAVQDPEKEPMLWVAIDADNVEAAKLLILYGADLDWEHVDGWTAASGCDSFEMLQALLEAGANPKEPKVLDNAIIMGSVPATRLLLSLGANPNATRWNGQPFLHLAYDQMNTELVRVLLEYQADPDVAFRDETLSYRAINDGRINVLHLVLDFHANPSIETDDGTPLLYAPVIANRVTIVKILVERGANVHWQAGGFSLTWHSVLSGHYEMTNLLLSYGLDVNWRQPASNISLLDQAAFSKHLAVVELLLERGANPNILSSNGEPLVIEEGANGIILPTLLRFGADVNTKDTDGVPLIARHLLDTHRDPAILAAILAYRPDLSWRNANGDSLAIIAAGMNDSASLIMLLRAGIDLTIKNNAGHTALVTAIHRRADQAIRVLRDAGRLADEDAFAVLRATVESRNVALLQSLCHAGLYDRLTLAQSQELYTYSSSRTR